MGSGQCWKAGRLLLRACPSGPVDIVARMMEGPGSPSQLAFHGPARYDHHDPFIIQDGAERVQGHGRTPRKVYLTAAPLPSAGQGAGPARVVVSMVDYKGLPEQLERMLTYALEKKEEAEDEEVLSYWAGYAEALRHTALAMDIMLDVKEPLAMPIDDGWLKAQKGKSKGKKR